MLLVACTFADPMFRASVQHEASPSHAQVAEKSLSKDEEDAFRMYTDKFGECRDGSNPGC